MMRFTHLFFLSLIFATPALAQEKISTPEYSPNHCQFTAKFPVEPFITHKCDGESKETCYDLISYTKVFGLSTTITVEIICNPSTPEMYAEFTPEVMETTVRAMTKDTVIEAYEIKARQEKEYRQSGLLGRGRKGLNDTIYIAQLWIADHSIMSVEAELIGEQSTESDLHFAEILRGIGYTKDLKNSGVIKENTPPAPESVKNILKETTQIMEE